MASHFLQLNDRISQGEGAPANGDALCTSTSLFPVGAIYIDNNTGILYARNTANGNAADWVNQSGGGGIDDVLAEAQALTAARVVDLDGNTLEISGGNVGIGVAPTVLFQVQSGGNDLIKISESGTNVFIGISGTNQNGLNGASTGSDASATLYAWYNNEAKSASIQAFANVSTGTLAYVADTHTFTGQAIFNSVQEFADNAAVITGGLATGAIYRTGDVLKIVH